MMRSTPPRPPPQAGPPYQYPPPPKRMIRRIRTRTRLIGRLAVFRPYSGPRQSIPPRPRHCQPRPALGPADRPYQDARSGRVNGPYLRFGTANLRRGFARRAPTPKGGRPPPRPAHTGMLELPKCHTSRSRKREQRARKNATNNSNNAITVRRLLLTWAAIAHTFDSPAHSATGAMGVVHMLVNIGKGIEFNVDLSAMGVADESKLHAGLAHYIRIGARNVLMDAHASITEKEYPEAEARVAAAKAVAEKKLLALMSGEVRVAEPARRVATPSRRLSISTLAPPCSSGATHKRKRLYQTATTKPARNGCRTVSTDG
jgi:hypothetical protein